MLVYGHGQYRLNTECTLCHGVFFICLQLICSVIDYKDHQYNNRICPFLGIFTTLPKRD